MLTLAWDVDDVLNDLMRTWLETHWLPAHPGCSVRYEEIVRNPPSEILGVSLEDYLASLDVFRLSGDFERMPPSKEVLGWFSTYGHLFRHIAVTAVPLKAASVSAAWVMRHFGPWIRTFHVVPSPRKTDDIPLYDGSKQDFLRRLGGVDYFIDDSEENISGREELGAQGILFPRPWNRSLMTITQTLGTLTEASSRGKKPLKSSRIS